MKRLHCSTWTRCLLLVAANLTFAFPATAERGSQLLTHGESYGDVLKRFGPPEERIVYETKREEEWRYPELRIRFHEGSVSNWEDSSERSAATRPFPATETSSDTNVPNERAVAVEDILSEIMKELPDEGGSNP